MSNPSAASTSHSNQSAASPLDSLKGRVPGYQISDSGDQDEKQYLSGGNCNSDWPIETSVSKNSKEEGKSKALENDIDFNAATAKESQKKDQTDKELRTEHQTLQEEEEEKTEDSAEKDDGYKPQSESNKQQSDLESSKEDKNCLLYTSPSPRD